LGVEADSLRAMWDGGEGGVGEGGFEGEVGYNGGAGCKFGMVGLLVVFSGEGRG